MSCPLLSRFSLRLLVPTLALSALAAFGDPLPPVAPADRFEMIVQSEVDAQQRFALAVREEAETLRLEAEAAKKAASRTAAQMRWFLTLPAGNPRSAPARVSNAG
jgi:uncharacterized small protein (DUF1192 family)